jgi:CO/xanthine dehydrogenase Mo-binding subunit/aerobic-type carbon monoxide dehydrogenase small subunit (CoxS/CutS family)
MSEQSGDIKIKINMTINDVRICVEDEALFDKTLLNYIRENLGQKDVKCGCGKGYCGSCTLILNGEAKKSCVIKIKNINGAVILTPGFINSTELSKYAALLHKHGAVQCGFCFAGISASLEAKLKNVETPSEKDVIKALDGHICRCTGYKPIIDAVLDRPPAADYRAAEGFKNIGASPVRGDSAEKLKGSALYADDIEFENMLRVYVLRSEYAHADIISIDAAAAGNAPGVALVLTHKDLPGAKKFGALKDDQPVLCSEKVLFRGDAIAMIAAETLEQAKAAAALIKVEYRPLKPIFSAQEALAEGAAALCGENNILCEIKLKSKKDAAAFFSENDGFASATGFFKMGAIEHAYMEPECSVACFDEENDKLIIYTGSQNIHAEKEEIALILGVPSQKVEIQLTHTGGGFGGKEDLTTQPYSALAAYFTKRPCKYLMSREESLLCSTKKHPFDIKIGISADKNGIFGGISVEAVSNAGPYESLSRIVLTRFATHILGPYTWRAYDISVTGARTNNLIAGAMRGFGVNQACYAVESMIDRLAAKFGISAEKIRLLNMIEDGKIMGLGEIARDSSGLQKSFGAVLEHIDRSANASFNLQNTSKKRGAGIALAYKNMGLGNNSPRDNCSVRISAAPGVNKLIIYTAASEIGQGLYNILKQIAAEASGLDPDSIEISWGSTQNAPPAGVTSASRQTFMSGNAVLKAAGEFKDLLINKITQKYNLKKTDAALSGESIIFSNNFTNPDGILTIWDYINKIEKTEITLTVRFEAPATSELGKAGSEGFKSHFGYSYAAHGVIVEVDLESKKFKILKIAAAHDAGRALNPAALEGQIIGGVVMGLGYAVSENLKVENGVPDKRGLAGAGLLKAKDIPPITPIIIETPHPEGPYGARGIGEISTVPVAAALCNALLDASGIEFNTLPINLDINGFKYSPE